MITQYEDRVPEAVRHNTESLMAHWRDEGRNDAEIENVVKSAVLAACANGFTEPGIGTTSDSLLTMDSKPESSFDIGPVSPLPLHSPVESEAWYQGLDPGIRFAVRVLHARGIETGQSCEGGEGHAYDHPTVDLRDGGPRSVGFAALAALEDYGLRVRDIALLWPVDKGLPSECFWRVTLRQPWHKRADSKPIFEWHYRAVDSNA